MICSQYHQACPLLSWLSTSDAGWWFVYLNRRSRWVRSTWWKLDCRGGIRMSLVASGFQLRLPESERERDAVGRENGDGAPW